MKTNHQCYLSLIFDKNIARALYCFHHHFQAVCHNNLPMVEYLLSIGARSDIRDSSGLTALDEAQKRNLKNIEDMLMNCENTN